MSLAVNGSCDAAFATVGDAFAEGFETRGELGASVAVWAGGRLVVDLWGGLADPVAGRAWERDTIVHAYSVSKPLVSACALLLADRGELDLDAPVARYWPEYAAAGKERTLVRHLLTHQAGMVVLADPLPAGALLDWERLAALLAAAPPLWEPGTRHGEQALFFGHLVGELVRRVDGRPLGRFFADEIAGPWGLDFHFGLGSAEQGRCARLVDEGGAWRRSLLDDPRPLLAQALDNPPGILDADVVNSAPYRAAEVPSVNGHGTARAIATFYGGLAAGGALGGVRLLEAATVDEALTPWATGEDALLETEVSWGLGLQTDPDAGDFGLGGIGGFSGFGIRRDGAEVGFGYVTCKLGSHERGDACEEALERVLSARRGRDVSSG
jgi:CubicO group peptidase (beta-lactamase class C family)